MHVHILGIGGTFMGSLARLAAALGHKVTGCDTAVYPPMSDQLRAAGIEVIEGFSGDQTALKPDIFVVGNVVRRGHALMEEILSKGLPYTSGPQWVKEHVLKGRHVIAVAGTHGKTTTTAMVAHILQEAGRDPGFLIGGVPINFGVSARLGAYKTVSSPFVIEADEYDTAFFDKRSKFLHYPACTAILNNLEFDHADIFANVDAIETQFHHWVRTLAREARIVVNNNSPALQRVLARGCYSRCDYFADDVPQLSPSSSPNVCPTVAQASHHPEHLVWQAKSSSISAQQATDGVNDCFEVSLGSEYHGQVAWSLSGQHNRSNAVAAIAAVQSLGVGAAQACAALSGFKNVVRRMSLRGEIAGVRVYDDFAHHPTAIATTIAGLARQLPANSRILAVLEPRSNTMKIGALKDRLPDSLRLAHSVFCYNYQLGWDVAQTLAPLASQQGKPLWVGDDISALVAAVVAHAQRGDAILVMSNGGFDGVHDKLLHALEQTQ